MPMFNRWWCFHMTRTCHTVHKHHRKLPLWDRSVPQWELGWSKTAICHPIQSIYATHYWHKTALCIKEIRCHDWWLVSFSDHIVSASWSCCIGVSDSRMLCRPWLFRMCTAVLLQISQPGGIVRFYILLSNKCIWICTYKKYSSFHLDANDLKSKGVCT